MADLLIEPVAQSAISNTGILFGPYYIDKDIGVILYATVPKDLVYRRTIDGGATWSAATIIHSGDIIRVDVFFDQEVPGDNGNELNICMMDSVLSDVLFRTLNISTETLGIKRTVNSTLTVSTNTQFNRMALTKTVGGNIMIAFSTQIEVGCIKSSDLFATAGTVISDVYETGNQEDCLLLYPATTIDNNDVCGIFWDRSSNEITTKMYNDLANTWTEKLILTGMVDSGTRVLGNDSAVRHSDGFIVGIAHTDEDKITDDLKAFTVNPNDTSNPPVSIETDVFTNIAEAGMAAVVINQQNDDVYAAYARGVALNATVDVFYKKSTDNMLTWGSEIGYSEDIPDDIRVIRGSRTIGSNGGRFQPSFFNDDLNDIFTNLTNDVEILAVSGGAFKPYFAFPSTHILGVVSA